MDLFNKVLVKSGRIAVDENQFIVDGLNDVEVEKQQLGKLVKLLKGFGSAVDSAIQQELIVVQGLVKLAENETANPSPDMDASPYVTLLSKMGELVAEFAKIEGEFIETTETVSEHINDFVKNDLIEKTRNLNKSYEVSKLAYEKILGKIQSIKTAKNLAVSKLYLAELERSSLYQDYLSCQELLVIHLEDISQVTDINIIRHLIEWSNAYKQMLGFCYSHIKEMIPYLGEMQRWVNEEQTIFESHFQDRAEQRSRAEEEINRQNIVSFVESLSDQMIMNLYSTLNTHISSNELGSIIAGVFVDYDVPLPEILTNHQDNVTRSQLSRLQNMIRENFDIICTPMVEEGLRDPVMILAQGLAGIENSHLHYTGE